MLPYLFPFLILASCAFLSVRLRKLTQGGGIAATIVGMMVFLGVGYTGILLLVVFFVMGTLATSFNKQVKAEFEAADENQNGRTAGQVLANGGVAALMGLLAFLIPNNSPTFLLMFAGSLSAAIADTLSSEIGMVWGKRFYNILNFKKDQRGLNGVVSVEGSFAGILGSCLVAFLYVYLSGTTYRHFAAILVAGTMGNLADSLLGATLEKKHVLNNNMVNAMNTIIGALCVLIFT